MKRSISKVALLVVLFLMMIPVSAQQEYDLVEIVDRLRYDWDRTAIALKDYQGIQNFCADSVDQLKTLELH